MLTRKELDAAAEKIAEQLKVNDPEFLKRHEEIMSDIEKAREGLGESKRQTEAGPDL
ncbi:hypothetical protein EDD59_11126 [Muricomes intestini]|jgi:hypothetical protein|uniref:Uncharacterized protein n=1 Tax=Muricomes intestini TaxID=1796634 RepID=A0A4R3K739_9FIRM|nr:hypothetical protein [Muricomes intestini]TCS78501.1 hypothetical protein EDD59_11126 [Muricomes intestini]